MALKNPIIERIRERHEQMAYAAGNPVVDVGVLLSVYDSMSSELEELHGDEYGKMIGELRRQLNAMTTERDMLVGIKIALEEKIERYEALLRSQVSDGKITVNDLRVMETRSMINDVHVHSALEYRIGRLELRPGDVLIIKTNVQPSTAQLEQMRRQVEAVIQDTRCLVLANGEDLSVLSREEIERRSQPDGVAS